ncbi:uncharacterized protein A1O9_02822 [Exophiala aquamarina CBS 119918]|uniref:Uncharacterized protein n=1 Tax=Exophiala aquamarina CBS 119918 TaxID=1182545 RepID=A0A072PNG1_9EURO|nr:uncharacterized protein A1O9_02822 [Exophiala aquamarina CBS 119918]KEF61257.1 hypothetical protein A1O9_02822 [Exophiala aquamarina CBS 119918]
MGQLGDISPEGSVAIGIIVGLLSTSIQSLGLTLQRKSHLIEDAKDQPETRRPAYKRKKWQLGMLMFVVSNVVGSTIQITTLPLPVLSTLQASGLVFNTAFATILLGEPFTRFSIVGTVLTCSGAALIATFGAIAEPAHSLGQLLELLNQRDFIIWMVGTLIVVVGTILFAHLLKIWSSHQHITKNLSKSERTRTASLISTGASPRRPSLPQLTIAHSLAAQLPPPLKLRLSRLRLIRGLSYALISGILSAHSLLVAKSAVELLVRTIIDHNNQFNRFQSWLILVALLFFALTQLYYLHLGLLFCSTSVLYPFVFCIYNIIAILDGLIYFQQASRLSALHAGFVALGTVILLCGVLALSWRLDDTTPAEAAHQALPPRTPLTPGMGLVQSPSEERGPLFPSGHRRSSASPSRQSIDEQTPLLVGRARPPTLTLRTPSETNSEGIWAELDDEESQQDYLASLPRTPSPFLTHNSKTRRRGNSASSQAVSMGSRRSSSGSNTRKADMEIGGLGEQAANGAKQSQSSAPQLQASRWEGEDSTHARKRSTSVRFANDEGQSHDQRPNSREARASRYYQSGGTSSGSRGWVANWLSLKKGDQQQRQQEEQEQEQEQEEANKTDPKLESPDNR